MKLHQLQYFREVCAQNGITKAAETLHISQPAVSNAIKELEEEFHVKLFKRVDKRLILTKEGAYFLLEVEELLSRANALTQKMYHLGTQKNLIRIGLPPMISVMAFRLIQDFHSAHPEIELELYDEASLTLRRMLQEDKVDVIIVSGMNTDFTNLGFCKLQRSELLFCVNRNHQLAGEPCVSIAHAALEPVVMFKSSFHVREKVLERFHENGCTPRVMWTTQQLYTQLQLIRNGMAAGFLFREIVENEEDITGIPLDPPMETDIEMVWLKNGKVYQDINCFIRFTQEHCRKYGRKCVKE